MSYVEHPPPAQLSPWLACVWERTGDGAEPVRVLPDGCIDVVWAQASGISLVGANRQAFLAPVPAGQRVVGARLRPGGAPALLAVGAERVLDDRLELSEVLGDEGRRLGATLEQAADPVGSLHVWLTVRAAMAERPDPVVVRAVRRLDDGCDRIGVLAGEVGLSERALRRRVTTSVGYGPKRLGRVLRLWRALRAVRAGEELAAAAFVAGYVDQAHFSHDCRELAGVPPSALAAS